jgi:hypothetical protein
MTSLPKVPAMEPDLKGATMRGPELRRLRSELTAAEDSKIHLVLELVDRLEARGEADSLIAPLRGRLAKLKPKRKLTFARLLFTPFNPVIVDTPDWWPDSPAIPRTALAPLARYIQSKLDNADPCLPPDMTNDDLESVLALGRTLWPCAAKAVEDAKVPQQWSTETGLRDQDFTALSTALRALFPQVAPLIQLAIDAGKGIDPEPEQLLAMLQAIAPAGAHATAIFIAMGLGWLPSAKLFVKIADEFANTIGNSSIANRAVEFVLSEIEQPTAYKAGLTTAVEKMRRAAVILEDLVDSSPNRPGRRNRIEQVRQSVDSVCRESFVAEVANQLVEPSSAIAMANDEDVAALEDTARALRRFESVAKKFGGTEFYDRHLRGAAQALSPQRDEDTAARISRIRLIEILRGPDAAAAAMQGSL